LNKSWIRLYTDVPNNPKVQRLPGNLFKFWINCLCIYGQRGYFPPAKDLAWALKLTEKATMESIKSLIEAGLLEESPGDKGFEAILVDAIAPHDWADLQFESDSSKERVRKFRERHRKQARNVTVTAQEADTEQIQSRAEPEAEPPGVPDSYVSEFTAAICALGFRNPENDPVTNYTTAMVAEVCEKSGATPKLGAFVAADLLKAQRFRDKPLEYLLGALRSQLAAGGPNRKALQRASST